MDPKIRDNSFFLEDLPHILCEVCNQLNLDKISELQLDRALFQSFT